MGGARDLIGPALDEHVSIATLDEAAMQGISTFDTAERYADGARERMMGRWLSEREASVTAGVRVTTKVAAGRYVAFDAASIEPVFAGSLERLGVDRIDWLLVHASDPDTPVAGMLGALEAIGASGRCGSDARRGRRGCHRDPRRRVDTSARRTGRARLSSPLVAEDDWRVLRMRR